MGEKRVTSHSARTGRNGVFAAKHNDRNFDISKADHINPEMSKYNIYQVYKMPGEPDGMNFEEHEKYFYRNNFRRYLTDKNKRYKNQRHEDRCQTMEDYRRSPRSCPDEIIFQFGNKDDHVSPEQLQIITDEVMGYLTDKYPNFHPLDMALHVDEATPHIHLRGVWMATDEHGLPMVSQSKALEEMHVERPQPDLPSGRHNNAKMTFSSDLRAEYERVCEHCGFKVNRERLEASKVGLDQMQYKLNQEKEKSAAMEAVIASKSQKLDELEEIYTRTYNSADLAIKALKKAQQEKELTEKQLSDIKQQIKVNTDTLSDLRRQLNDCRHGMTMQAASKLVNNIPALDRIIRDNDRIINRIHDDDEYEH